jgi:hypothetical protein
MLPHHIDTIVIARFGGTFEMRVAQLCWSKQQNRMVNAYRQPFIHHPSSRPFKVTKPQQPELL